MITYPAGKSTVECSPNPIVSNEENIRFMAYPLGTTPPAVLGQQDCFSFPDLHKIALPLGTMILEGPVTVPDPLEECFND